MYTLSKEQRISNLEEIINQKNQKIDRLQTEVQNLLKKLEKIKKSEDSDFTQEFQEDEPERSHLPKESGMKTF